jgi:hypothetical protein
MPASKRLQANALDGTATGAAGVNLKYIETKSELPISNT